MPQIIVSVALASQIFIQREPSAHPMMPGREIDRVTIKGGAGLSKRLIHDPETGKKRPTPDECDFATTTISDEQFDWLKDDVTFKDMVAKGWLRAMPISEREAEKLTKPHHIEAEVEHLIPTMRSPADQKDRQKTPEDFSKAGKKLATGGAL